METRYQFARSVTVDGVPYKAGDVVTRDRVPAGYFESCVRVGHLVELPAGTDPAAGFVQFMGGAAPPEPPASPPPAADPLVGPPAEPPAPAPAPVAEPKPEKPGKKK